jgi:hypothetical protein
VYRQIVEYLAGKEMITLPDDLPTEGPKNECRYDLPASMFNIADEAVREGNAEVHFDGDGLQVTTFRFALNCMRGLRYSHYENEFTDADGATTFYIA